MESSKKNTNYEIAERIAASFGTKPEIITVKMVGHDDVRDLISRIQEAQRRAHENPIHCH